MASGISEMAPNRDVALVQEHRRLVAKGGGTKVNKRNRRRKAYSYEKPAKAEDCSDDEASSLANQRFPGALLHCVVCCETLPEARKRWTFLVCCGLGACRACLHETCPQCHTALPTEQDLVHFLRTKAEQGNADAQFELGQHLLHLQQAAEATKFLALASNAGHVEAAFLLGFHLDDGSMLDPDPKRAHEFYAIAAEAGHAGAAMFLDQLLHQSKELR